MKELGDQAQYHGLYVLMSSVCVFEVFEGKKRSRASSFSPKVSSDSIHTFFKLLTVANNLTAKFFSSI